jgi:DNA repair protein SbcC/Rad50
MRLLQLSFENFRSFARCDLNLNADGLIAVVGPNGAGKSTIFAAVEWALYGGSRGRGTIPVRRHNCPEKAPCFVTLEFEVGGRGYRVHRIDHKDATLTDLESEVVLANSLSGVTREVTKTLGLTQEAFCGTFYARQKEVQALDSARAPERREQLERLLGIEQLRRASEFAGRDAREQKIVVEALAADAPDMNALKEEVERVEREAQQTAPAVQEASAKLEAVKEQRKAARERVEALHQQERLAADRRTAAEQARSALATAALTLEVMREQIHVAESAAAKVAELAPLAARADELAARERELDLRREQHEQTQILREKEREALKAAAELADQVAQRPAEGDNDEVLPKRVEESQAELEALSARLIEIARRKSVTGVRLTDLRDQVAKAARISELEQALTKLDKSEVRAQEARERWHQLRAEHAALQSAIAHDLQHRDAIVRDGKSAACPTCKRPYEDDWEDILASYERDLATNQEALEALTQAIDELSARCTSLEEAATREREFRAERSTLGAIASVEELRSGLASESEAAAAIFEEETLLTARHAVVAELLPKLRKQWAELSEARQATNKLVATRDQAERDARLFAEQLAGVSGNGYDPDAHQALRAQLSQAQQAVQQTANFKAHADGLAMLQSRAETQEKLVAEAERVRDGADEALREAALDPEAVDAARVDLERLDLAVDEGQNALLEAERQALLDSQAVATARERLNQARSLTRRLQHERRELLWRGEVATSLSAFREEASRRARPTIEAETSLLLGQVTRGRYGTATLSDSYLLEVVEDGAPHPLKRFSGGEQDLASLCLRLALSRTLARQRGAEAGFVILDEVFGSQDIDRRATLLAQLRQLAEREFRQLFVVSHTEDVTEHCDLSVRVERRTDGLSLVDGPRP